MAFTFSSAAHAAYPLPATAAPVLMSVPPEQSNGSSLASEVNRQSGQTRPVSNNNGGFLPNDPRLGMTAPLSTKAPTPDEEARSQQLLEFLRSKGQFETEEDSRKREIALAKLSVLAKEFVKRSLLQRGYSEADAQDAGGKIFTFGSYRLGAHGAGADIDTLLVGPRLVSREDFFTNMVDLLREQPDVTELVPVPGAAVPLISFSVNGIPIDLLYARLALPKIPDDIDLLDNKLLRNLDQQSVSSLNGSRVTDTILRLVPNVETFHLALRAIKLWGKNRGVYSHVLGYLGGVSWALCTARVCQMYPNATASVVVSRFFKLYDQWKWPFPVLLKANDDVSPAVPGVMGWRQQQKFEKLPVITPAFPSMNSSHNVFDSTFAILLEEFKRGMEVTQNIEVGLEKWEKLFEKSDFFHRYRHYLQISVYADTEDQHRSLYGLVEARLRRFLHGLEICDEIERVHPFPKNYQSVTFVDEFGNEVSDGDLNEDGSPKRTTRFTARFYVGIMVRAKRPGEPAGTRTVVMNDALTDFQAKIWQTIPRASGMDVVVKVLKDIQLPDEVFDKNEERPSAKRRVTKKRTQSEKSEGTFTKKRKLSMSTEDGGMDGPPISTQMDTSNGEETTEPENSQSTMANSSAKTVGSLHENNDSPERPAVIRPPIDDVSLAPNASIVPKAPINRKADIKLTLSSN